DPGVVDQHVDPPERCDRRLDDRLDGVLVGDVGDDPVDRPDGTQRAERVLQLRLLETGDEHAGALVEEPLAGPEPDPARPPDDQAAGVLEPSHQRTIPRAVTAISRSTSPARIAKAESKRFTAEHTWSGITSRRSPIRSSVSPTRWPTPCSSFMKSMIRSG